MNIKIFAFCRKERLSKNQTAKVYLRFTKNRKSRYVRTEINILNRCTRPTEYHRTIKWCGIKMAAWL